MSKEKIKWISVKDKLPKKCQKVLFVYKKNNEVDCGYYGCSSFEDVYFYDTLESSNELATHWMELPEPPEEL